MTVGREISPECSTDERREWQKGAAALAISSRRPTGWLGSRMIRNMYASGSSPVAAASCRTSSFAQLAAPLGRPAPGRFPPCPFIVLSRGDRNPRAAPFGIPVHLYYNTPSKKVLDLFLLELAEIGLGIVMTSGWARRTQSPG
jgi:hypothetical protein